VVLFAVLALFVVRVAAVAIAATGSGLPTRSTLFVGWFGPRGIGTIVLGLIVLQDGEIRQGGLITQAVAVTVTLSLVIHSLTTPVGIRLCQHPDTAASDVASPAPATGSPETHQGPHPTQGAAGG